MISDAVHHPAEQIFERLLQIGVRPITDDRQMLERLGFAPHYDSPPSRYKSAIWSRTVDIRGTQVTQFAFFSGSYRTRKPGRLEPRTMA